MAKWFCDICNVEVDKSQKARHIRSIRHQNNINPPETISDILPIDAIEEINKKKKKYIKKNVKKRIYKCEICDKEIKKKNIKNHRNSNKHKKMCLKNNNIDPITDLEIKLLKSSFNTTFVSFIIKITFIKILMNF